MKRDHTQYPGFMVQVPSVGTIIDINKLMSGGADAFQKDDLFVMPASIHLNDFFRLQFKAWRSVDAFETYQDPLTGDYLKTLRVAPEMYDAFYMANKATIDLIHAENLEFLGNLDPAKYKTTEIVIDIDALTIRGEAERISVKDQKVIRSVSDPLEFNDVKTSNTAFVNALLGFAIGYGQANDPFLGRLTPITA